ncbi:hypothetical protein CGRA01v4_10478 [Colletotrichum graminicola]|uniref:Uncharacterized protein n=1 Tax=Colletotrichum graminicola (strain M1.001 / M2 / FGSC 10212) TaxID=645133 RepID=E3QZY9_COLGM|nr:uncharacterized protein GLRG_11555 [Colletotrichum graminicola M1.001]EFQ36427.1 hypothetical protein GLRG_11555 [Colletotrichum graminicola M1.001]WDK19191.1 hypothetical protein CGRA01v4_10478 [Colletotrichum graminicola]
MGGCAFAHHGLDTPRMPPEIYEHVKAKCTAALRELYICVASPIEGPEKEDFGDIDIVLTWEKAPLQARSITKPTSAAADDRADVESQESGDEECVGTDDEEGQERSPAHSTMSPEEARRAIGAALGAEYTMFSKVGGHYAIPWPASESPIETDEVQTDEEPKRYIQIDITICESLQQMQWNLFKNAHGDLWSILGSIIKPYMLTADGHALFLRNPDIESFEKYKSLARLRLTRDPAEILLFLGLDVARYSEPFATRQEMYEYAASCRLFRVHPDAEYDESGQLESAGSPISTAPTLLSTGPDPTKSPISKNPMMPTTVPGLEPSDESEPARKKLKAKDRKRLKTRLAFRQWHEEFVPRCRQEGRFLGEPFTWLNVTEDAFDRFCIRPWYKRVHLDVVRSRSEDRVLADVLKTIDNIVPADPADPKRCQFRGGLKKALKKIIFQGDKSYGVAPERELRDGLGLMIKDEIDRFVSNKWKEVGDAAMERNQKRFKEHCRGKGKARQD